VRRETTATSGATDRAPHARTHQYVPDPKQNGSATSQPAKHTPAEIRGIDGRGHLRERGSAPGTQESQGEAQLQAREPEAIMGTESSPDRPKDQTCLR
jgi:hypothetical protein